MHTGMRLWLPCSKLLAVAWRRRLRRALRALPLLPGQHPHHEGQGPGPALQARRWLFRDKSKDTLVSGLSISVCPRNKLLHGL